MYHETDMFVMCVPDLSSIRSLANNTTRTCRSNKLVLGEGVIATLGTPLLRTTNESLLILNV